MKCFECGDEAVILLDDEASWKNKTSGYMTVMSFKKALCRKHFEDWRKEQQEFDNFIVEKIRENMFK